MSKPFKHSQAATYTRLSALILAVGASGVIGLKLLFSSSAATIPGTSQADLAQIIQDVPGSAIYRYNTTDNQGYGMDTMKVIANPAGGYLAVYHASNVVRLASSTDLKNWAFKANLASPATAPTIQAVGNGFLVADEYNNRNLGYVHIMYYSSLANLYAGKFDKQFVAPHTLTTCSEGTPNIYSANLQPDINHSTISFGFHYQNTCDTERQATGTLTNFSSWTSSVATTQNSAISAAAAKTGNAVNGDIGDRDALTFGSTQYSIHEVQYAKNDNATWHPYLFNFSTNQAQALNVKTHKGSVAFANPTFTALKGPDGTNGIVVTLYLPSNRAATGEAGELLYYVRTTNPPVTPAPAPAPAPTPAPKPVTHPAATPSPVSASGTKATASPSTTAATAGAISPQPATNAANDIVDPSKVVANDAKVLAETNSSSATKHAGSPVRTWIVTLSAAAIVLALGGFLLHRRRHATVANTALNTDAITPEQLNEASIEEPATDNSYTETKEDVAADDNQTAEELPAEEEEAKPSPTRTDETAETSETETEETETTDKDADADTPAKKSEENVIDWSRDNDSKPPTN